MHRTDEIANGWSLRDGLPKEVRNSAQLPHSRGRCSRAPGSGPGSAACRGPFDSEHAEREERGGEGLGGGDCALRPGPGDVSKVRPPDRFAPRFVRHHHPEDVFVPCLVEKTEDAARSAGLGHGHQDAVAGVLSERPVNLARGGDRCRKARLLEPTGRNLGGVATGPGAGQQNPLSVQRGPAPETGNPLWSLSLQRGQGRLGRLRLLVDLEPERR